MRGRARSIQPKFLENFGPKLNRSARSNRKNFGKISPPFEVDHFSRMDLSDRNGSLHLTIPTYTQFENLAVRYLPCIKWRKILINALLLIVNSGSIGFTRTSMYSYDRSVAASQAKCMFWRLLTIYFPKEFARFFSSFDSKTSNVVFEVTWQISGNGLLKITRYTG